MDKRQRAEIDLAGSPTKRRLLKLVVAQPRSLTDLAKAMGITPPSVHQHVNDLMEMGLVTKEAVGRRAIVSATTLGAEFYR